MYAFRCIVDASVYIHRYFRLYIPQAYLSVISRYGGYRALRYITRIIVSFYLNYYT